MSLPRAPGSTARVAVSLATRGPRAAPTAACAGPGRVLPPGVGGRRAAALREQHRPRVRVRRRTICPDADRIPRRAEDVLAVPLRRHELAEDPSGRLVLARARPRDRPDVLAREAEA